MHVHLGKRRPSASSATARVAALRVRRRRASSRSTWSSISAGIRPRDELARAGRARGRRARRHRRRRRRSAPAIRAIFAIGECALAPRHDLRPGRARLRDGRRARGAPRAASDARASRAPTSRPSSSCSASTSRASATPFADETAARTRARRVRGPRARRLPEARALAPTATRLLGGILVGDARAVRARSLARCRARRRRCPSAPHELLFGARAAAPRGAPAARRRRRSARATTSRKGAICARDPRAAS